MKKITQSFIKAFQDYLNGDLCGHLIDWQFVQGKLIPPTKAMKVGIYFEYQVSGALPKDKKIPQPEMMKNGKDMYADYRNAYQNAGKLREMLESKGLKIVKAGYKVTKGRFEGTIDMVVEAVRDIDLGNGFILKTGERIVIDLKYSGLIGDRWNRMGWNVPELTPEQREYHAIQATQYNYLMGIPFFYLIHASKNTREGDRNSENEDEPTNGWPMLFFNFEISERATKEHIAKANNLNERFEMERDTGGFKARPSYSKCVKCPIAYQCKDKHTFPEPTLIKF